MEINTKTLKSSVISPKNFYINNGMSFNFVKTGYRERDFSNKNRDLQVPVLMSETALGFSLTLQRMLRRHIYICTYT